MESNKITIHYINNYNVCFFIFNVDAGMKACGTPNGKTTYTNLGANPYFMSIHVGPTWDKNIETKSADPTNEVLNFNDPRFYSIIRLCD
jgi:hypothetical protein